MAFQKKVKKQQNSARKKKRVYSEKELNIPVLNTVAQPAAIEKRRKKGKTFVENDSAMLDILAEVNDAREGQIRSKLERVKSLEEIRERKRLDLERKERSKLSIPQAGNVMKRTEARGQSSRAPGDSAPDGPSKFYGTYRNKKKLVSFVS